MLQTADAYLIVGNDLVLPLAASDRSASGSLRRRASRAVGSRSPPVTAAMSAAADEAQAGESEDARTRPHRLVLFCLAVAALVAVWALVAVMAIGCASGSSSRSCSGRQAMSPEGGDPGLARR